MRILTDDEVLRIIDGLSPDTIKIQALYLLKQLHHLHHHPQTISQPPRQSIPHPPIHAQQMKNTTLYMPTILPTESSLKVVTISSSNNSSNQANTSLRGSLFLFSQTGELTSILNAHHLTAYRTALSSLIPFLHYQQNLLHSTPICSTIKVVIFGAGLVAQYTAKLLTKLFHSLDLSIFNRSYKNDLLTKLSSNETDTNPRLKLSHIQHPFPQNPSQEVKHAVQTADGIFCCTPSDEPLFPAELLSSAGITAIKKQQYISLIGSFTRDMKEVDPILLHSTEDVTVRVIVDNEEACRKEAGEIISNIEKNIPMDLSELGELYDVTQNCSLHMADEINEKLEDEKLQELILLTNHNNEKVKKRVRIIYKSVGIGLMDLVIGQEVLKEAERKGVGRIVEGF